MKSGNLNFLEPSDPLQASNGADLPLPKFIIDLAPGYYWYFFQQYKQ